MKLAFNLEMTSQEAYLGILAGAIIFIIVLLRRGGDTNNITYKNSPGAQTQISQDKRTKVNINTKVSINHAAPSSPPPPPPREPRAGRGNGGGDDFVAIAGLAALMLLGLGFYYVQYFEGITLGSRFMCFTTLTYALLYGGWDIKTRGWLGDEIQWTYVLAALVSFVSAGFLLQAQDLIATDWVQAAQVQQHGLGALERFIGFFKQLPRKGWMFVIASLLSTVAVCFVVVASGLAILRALVLSQQDDTPASWLARTFLGLTEWVRPVRLLFLSIPSLGFVVFTLYVWLPHSLQMNP